VSCIACELSIGVSEYMKKTREYLQLMEKAIYAVEEAVDAFNRVGRPYKVETCLLLMTNAWELLAKAVLVKRRQSILKDSQGNTISAEVAVSRLKSLSLLDENQEDCIQQVISLRNCATHHILPPVSQEILHHLIFFTCKFFRQVMLKVFPSYVRRLSGNYLSLSFAELTTYADKVQKLVAKVKKSNESKKLVWLLERGIQFDGTNYISQDQFEVKYRRKRRVLPHLALSDFLRNTDMVRIVAVQAPRNYTADINLRKGSRGDQSLPVAIKKTDVEIDYPYLTKELGEKLKKNSNFIATTIKYLGLKGNDQYHQQVRASKKSYIHRYSQAALDKIKLVVEEHPDFNPYNEIKKNS
jgi:hypothetical protein